MGHEYKKRLKEWQGKTAVVAYETLQLGRTIAPAATTTGSTLADAQGISSYTVNRPAKLDGITVQLSSAHTLGSGSISVRALVNGAEVGSGVISLARTYGDAMFETEADAEIRLVTGDVLVLDVVKGATPSVQTLTARASLRLFEL